MHLVHVPGSVVAVIKPTDPDSLRERKRRATMVAIENAATTLVLEHGYDAVTVDEICARADVSKRTFFNYVPTKEAAVVGLSPESVPDDLREQFLADTGPDVSTALLGLFLATFARARAGDDSHTAALVQRLRAIVHENPDLGAARLTASSRLHTALVGIVTELLTRHPDLRRLDGVSTEDEARASVALASASVNLGVSVWLARETGTFDDLDDDCTVALGQLARLVAPATTGRPA